MTARIIAALTYVLTLSLTLSGAQAAPKMDQRLYDLGSQICANVANGDLDIAQARPYLDAVDAVSWERSEFCHCVGSEFGLNGVQKARMAKAEGDESGAAMLQILLTNMAICTPGQPVYADLITSKDDVWQCRQVMDGTYRIEGFDLAATLAEMRDGGRDIDQICGCAAGYISFAEGLAGPTPIGMAAQSPAYQMQIATGIGLCLNQ